MAGPQNRSTPELDARRTEALKDAILEASLDCIVTIDGESRVLEWNPAAERTFGYDRAEAIGANLPDLIIPSELRTAHRQGMARFLRTGEGPVIGRRVEVRALNKAGDQFPVELAISPTMVEGKAYFTAYIRDISNRLAAEAEAREREQRLKATYENAFAGIGEVDREGRFLRANAHFSTFTGYSPEELVRRTIWDITHPEDVALEHEMFAKHMRGELPTYTLEKRYVHKLGHEIWIELFASIVTDGRGQPLYGVRVVRDVTERRQWAEHQHLLVNELNHRVKNTLATVQSIASQTLRGAKDLTHARLDLDERLGGLARANDVLTRQSWERADLHAIVVQALSPYKPADPARILTDGPHVWLGPKCALALAMAFQELATNAVKYGCLSVEQGVLDISWSVETGDERDMLVLVWLETQGPTVVKPLRTGFGTRLLQQNLARELGGAVIIEFQASGLRCEIQAPL